MLTGSVQGVMYTGPEHGRRKQERTVEVVYYSNKQFCNIFGRIKRFDPIRRSY
ncbi:hypothetical protein ABEW60_20765 [Paenibacillus jamilae]|uniref:hypothetical protein n=1 Tax=Paenibacillus TaxID=44249 RepID=UPI001319C6AF|nr:hypothetical protein [Paenibacillus polymyxa]